MTFRRLFLITAAALPLASTANAQQETDWSAVQVTAQQIRPGVAVLFGNGGNIGVSYGEDGTIIIDDQFAPLTEKIQAAIAGLGAGPVKFLVNTHWHFDHAGGNENFGKAGALIFAQNNVRVRLAAGGIVAGNRSEPAPKAALPVVTFDQGLSFHVNGDTIDVIHTGGGHTDGDSVIYWREANVLHTGDMMMNRVGFPFIDLTSGGNVQHLVTSIDQMIAMTNADTVIIPGHGQIGNQADLIAWRGMIAAAIERVKPLKDAGRTLEQAKAAKPLTGLSNADGGFVSDDAFLEAIWGSLDAHEH
jgi:glyoxylase-like metal-dependent hydrolase (beta-lactamase superfamily II)